MSESAALRSAVERLADDMETQAAESTPVMGEVWTVAAREVRRVLASVGSSGEAESGEGDPAAQQLLRDIFGKHEDDTPAPVPSGGQADGEGEPALFRLVRDRDVSGVSGTGLVAWGVRWPDGRVATRWNADIAQTCAWDSMQHVEAIHGHGGATRVEWLAACPILSREAVRERLTEHASTCGSCHPVMGGSVALPAHLADVLTAGGDKS